MGPPYIYDPNMRYADSNVQAWAQYYGQGGKDPTGAVYFISVPGVKEPEKPATATTTAAEESSRRQSSLYNPYGNTVTNGTSRDAGVDPVSGNPHDDGGTGGGADQKLAGGGSIGPGYGASPYDGLTKDIAGMDIKG